MPDVLADAESFIEAGGAVVPLRPNSKRPFQEDWSVLPRLTLEEARRVFGPDANIGIRLGAPSRIGNFFVHGIDLDIRVATEAPAAREALRRLLGPLESYPQVISGSGGESRHFYFVSDEPFPTRKLSHSEGSFVDANGKRHWNWEIDFGGTGRQFVLPPSIHPTTRKPYVWAGGKPPDWRNLPFLLSIDIATWQAFKQRPRQGEEPSGDLLREFVEQMRALPAHGFTYAEVCEILDTIAADDKTHAEWCDDREGWLKVGFALHHHFQGADEGFELWCEFSSRSDKFDPVDAERVWQSMGGRRGALPVTLKSLKAAAKTARAGRRYGFTEDAEPKGLDTIDPIATPAGSLDELFEQVLRELQEAEEREASLWQKELDRSDDDGIKATMTNIALIARRDWRLRGVIGLNEFTHEIVQRQPFRALTATMFELPLRDPVNGDLWTDKHDVNLSLFLATRPNGKGGGYGFTPPDKTLNVAVVSAAHHNPFHPIRDYLNKSVWDGKPRLDTILIDYLGMPDTPYAREVARIMFVASVARIFEPGHKFDFAAIIEGPQGKRKSTFIETLGVNWFGRLTGDFGDRKKMVENMQGKWIIELPDLSGMARSHVNDVKAFMSDSRDFVRLSYGRRAAQFNRQSIFWGTSNDRHYLRDETGNRRFFPVPATVESIDTDRLGANIHQIWAEAKALYRRTRDEHPFGTLPLYLSGEAANDEAVRLQADRKVESASEIMSASIAEWLDTPRTLAEIFNDHSSKFSTDTGLYIKTRTCVAEVWNSLEKNPRHLSDMDSKTVSAALHAMPEWTGGARHYFGRFGRQRSIVRIGAAPYEVEKGYKPYLPH